MNSVPVKEQLNSIQFIENISKDTAEKVKILLFSVEEANKLKMRY